MPINGGTSAIGKKTNNELVKLIDGYVVEFNRNDTWRRGYMKLELMMQDKYKAGEAKAEAKAKVEKAQAVRNLYSNGVSISTIASSFSLTDTEVNNILSAK